MKKGNWTVIKDSGRTEFYQETDYFSVIAAVGHQYMQAGANWDRPNMLLLNGKVMVESGLAELGYKYVQRRRELYEEVTKKLNDEFAPEFEVTQ